MDLRELDSPAGPGSGQVHLEARGDVVVMSWLEPADPDARGGAYRLRVSRMEDGRWTEAGTVARSDSFFVNWADFPSVTPVGDGRLVGHWLERGPEGGYDYGVRVARSDDGGGSWSEPWTPHEDGTPQEHGFVTLFPVGGGGTGLVWLDGRDYEAHARAEEGEDAGGGAPARSREAAGTDPGERDTAGELRPSPGGPQMALRFRAMGPEGSPWGPSVTVDPRVCDCCQTDAATTADGVLVVYRDRSPGEVRDVYAARFGGEGWSEPTPVHDDGWVIGGCPVNGPAVSASGPRVVVAWFTAAGDVPRTRVAFSDDGGRSFGAPTDVGQGNPAGRADVELLEDGSALVSWLERGGGEDGEGARILVRRVRPDGSTSPVSEIAASTAARASGFPQLVRTGSGEVVAAWTDVEADRVRVVRAEVSP